MTKEEVLQRANDYCNERSYDSETLTDDFKDKFADFFVKRHPDAGIDDDGIVDELKFNLDTARSAAVKGLARQQTSFESKENDFKRQIEELSKKASKEPKKDKDEPKIPKELQEKLDELEKFKDAQRKQEKYKSVLEMAKKRVRQDLHKSLENYAADFAITLDETDEEQAKKLTTRFQEIFKDSIGDIKPLAPKQTNKRDEEILEQIPKVKV
jgi:uncharacterized protein YdeI (YjbR/CyaY-like superfamily)